MDEKLLEIIACPKCKGELVCHTRPEDEKEELICRACNLAYPVQGEIPILLEEEARSLGD